MNLQRRPLAKARIRIAHLSAGYGGVIVDGERIDYTPLCDEHWQHLLKSMPEDVATLREFLLEGSTDWDTVRNLPIYQIGWPGDAKLTVTGGKAAAAALRRWYPLRDHEAGDGDSVEPAPVESAEMASPKASNVVPINGPAVMRGIFDQQRYEDRN